MSAFSDWERVARFGCCQGNNHELRRGLGNPRRLPRERKGERKGERAGEIAQIVRAASPRSSEAREESDDVVGPAHPARSRTTRASETTRHEGATERERARAKRARVKDSRNSTTALLTHATIR